jgi:hypothetical protein
VWYVVQRFGCLCYSIILSGPAIDWTMTRACFS